MKNASRANAPAMPIDRRAALTGAGALLAGPIAASIPSTAKADDGLDAEVFALAARVKELEAERKHAYAIVSELKDKFEMEEPATLLIREGDEAVAGAQDGAFAKRIGKPFSQEELNTIRKMRPFFQTMAAKDELVKILPPGFGPRLERVIEIDTSSRDYAKEREAGRVAAGIRKAEANYEALVDQLKMARRDLAFMPARTIAGVHAKFDAVSSYYGPLEPEDCQEGCDVEEVVEMAICELVALRKEGERVATANVPDRRAAFADSD